ncbi:MAG: hypothetical protein HY231_00980 [Acidobacteria bacterium]|nr:hypothetical protein [Acidobacteriota bacterium]
MSFPETARLELPILEELEATGGSDQPRYLYDRLVRYFPQLTIDELHDRNASGRNRWHALVQRAGRQLMANGELRRDGSRWAITAKGKRRRAEENMRAITSPPLATTAPPKVTHKEAQQMLMELGAILGFYAQAEFDYYDVVWKASAASPRLSHVFEVQISGSVDSALTRLKHAYDAQRSRPFLIIADERDTRFADKRLSGSFHEIIEVITIIGVGELQHFYDSLKDQQTLLEKFLAGN